MSKEKSKSKRIAEKTIYAAFKILQEQGGELRGKEVVEKIPQLPRESFAWCTRFDYVEPSISWPPLSRQRGTKWHSSYNFAAPVFRQAGSHLSTVGGTSGNYKTKNP